MTLKSIYHVTGESDADLKAAKAILVMEIKRLLTQQGAKTQQVAATLLGWPRPDVANLLKGKFCKFSIERIYKALQRLEPTAQLVVTVEYVEPDVADRTSH